MLRDSIHSLFALADEDLFPLAADGRTDLLATYIIYIMCVCLPTGDVADGCGCAVALTGMSVLMLTFVKLTLPPWAGGQASSHCRQEACD